MNSCDDTTNKINAVVIIPALNPDINLIPYINDLRNRGLKRFIIVNDGSKKESLPVFDELSSIAGVELLHHKFNKGKGEALKTAFKYYLSEKMDESFFGVVTADADGQHSAADVAVIAQTLTKQNSRKLILGVRDFKNADMPRKNRFGNWLCSFAYKLFYGIDLSDTQTGLRGLTNGIIKPACNIPGKRFEYEMFMLIYMRAHHVGFKQIGISAIYSARCYKTHYRSVRDSGKIFAALIRGLFAKEIEQ